MSSLRRPGRALAGRLVAALAPELGRRDVEGQPHVLARAVAGRLDGAHQHAERRLGPRQVRREPALVADAGHVLLLPQEPLERVEDLGTRPGAPPRTSGSPAGTSMNSWMSSRLSAWAPPLITFIRGTGSIRAFGPPRYRKSGSPRSSAAARAHGERHAEDRVGAQRLLLGRAVELAERAVDQGLLGRVHALDLGRDHALHVAHGLQHPLAAEAPPVVVAKLEGLGAARRGARRHRRAPLGAAVEVHLDLEGGVARGSRGSRGRGRRRSRPCSGPPVEDEVGQGAERLGRRARGRARAAWASRVRAAARAFEAARP